MKRYYRYSAYALLTLLAAACMELVSMTQPDSAPINTGVDAQINIKVKLDDGPRTTLIVGMLAPVSWNVGQNAVVTYSSTDMPGGAITNQPMRLAVGADAAPDGKPWAQSMNDQIGYRGNYEPVEWVAFIAQQTHTWNKNDEFTGTVDVHFTTGGENLKTNLVYFIGNAKDGVNSDPQYYLLAEKVITTTGGEGPTIDYTLPKMCTMTPEAFTWEDIICFNYNATIQVDGDDSPLKGAEEVYFMGRATYDGGQEVVIDQISKKTRMNSVEKDKWFLHMYPHEFFGIPAGKKIEKISFYMVNADKSIVVKIPGSDEEFMLPENNK